MLFVPVDGEAFLAGVALLFRIKDTVDLAVVPEFLHSVRHHICAAERPLKQSDLEKDRSVDAYEVQRTVPRAGRDAHDRRLVDVVQFGIVSESESELHVRVEIVSVRRRPQEGKEFIGVVLVGIRIDEYGFRNESAGNECLRAGDLTCSADADAKDFLALILYIRPVYESGSAFRFVEIDFFPIAILLSGNGSKLTCSIRSKGISCMRCTASRVRARIRSVRCSTSLFPRREEGMCLRTCPAGVRAGRRPVFRSS